MTYNTYYLRFTSRVEAEQKLDEVGYSYVDEYTGETCYRVTGQVGDIDIVGDIYNDDATTELSEDGMMYYLTPPTKKNGYHVNIIKEGDLPEALANYVVDPLNPYRVFI